MDSNPIFDAPGFAVRLVLAAYLLAVLLGGVLVLIAFGLRL